MTQKQENYFNDLKKTYMEILEKEIRDVKERLEREGFKTGNFGNNAKTLREMAGATIDKLGTKFLDRGYRDTFRVRLDKNIQTLYLMGVKE